VVVAAAAEGEGPEAEELAALKRARVAAQRKAGAERKLVAAMREARDLGLSYARIGDSVGVTAQAVRQRLLRDARDLRLS
jgi:hypothetical protein